MSPATARTQFWTKTSRGKTFPVVKYRDRIRDNILTRALKPKNTHLIKMSTIDDRKLIVERLQHIDIQMEALSYEVVDIGRQIGRCTDQLGKYPKYANEFVQLKRVCEHTLNSIALSRYWSQLRTKTGKVFFILSLYNQGLHQADITRIYTEMENSANTEDQRKRMTSLLLILKKHGHLDTITYSPRNTIYHLKDRNYITDKLGIQRHS